MSTAANPTEVVEAELVKPLKGKYDKRYKDPRGGPRANSGAKPKWLKDFDRKRAAQMLIALDSIASLANIYQRAFEQNQLNTCVQIRENLTNRAFGKPFVAVNPDERKPPANVFNDNRIQMAIQQLLPGAKSPKPRKSKVKALPAAPDLT